MDRRHAKGLGHCCFWTHPLTHCLLHCCLWSSWTLLSSASLSLSTLHRGFRIFFLMEESFSLSDTGFFLLLDLFDNYALLFLPTRWPNLINRANGISRHPKSTLFCDLLVRVGSAKISKYKKKRKTLPRRHWHVLATASMSEPVS